LFNDAQRLETTNSASHNLLEIINGLLDFAKNPVTPVDFSVRSATGVIAKITVRPLDEVIAKRESLRIKPLSIS
jgi:hypothetical protein